MIYPTLSPSPKGVALCVSIVGVVTVLNSPSGRTRVGELDLTTASVFPYLLSRHSLYRFFGVGGRWEDHDDYR